MKKLLVISILLLAVFAAVSVSGAGVTYYVDAISGNDANNGTSPGTAWKTIAKVNAGTYGPGDSILFAGGQTHAGNLYFDGTSGANKGTAAAPITLASYGSGRAKITRAGVLTAPQIYLFNTAGFNIHDLILQGAGMDTEIEVGVGTWCDTLASSVLDYIRMDNVEAYGYYKGLCIYGGPGKQYTNITITNCVVHDCNHVGIESWSQDSNVKNIRNVYVAYCTTYNNLGDPNASGNTGSGIVLANVYNGLIEHCVSYNNGERNGPGHGGPVGIWFYDSDLCTIQFCEAYNNHTGGDKDGGGFDFDQNVTNSVIQYCYSHGNDGAGYLLCDGVDGSTNNVVRYNISQNDGRKNSYAGIEFYGKLINNYIYNNSIYVTPSTTGSPSCVRFNKYRRLCVYTNCKFWNNIFVTTGGATMIQANTNTGFMFQGNCYWPSGAAFNIVWGTTTYTSMSAWQTATGQEKIGTTLVGMQVNPLLVNPAGGASGFMLQAGSPCRDTGLNINAQFGINPGTRDYFGNAIPNGAYDIGCHEYGGAPPSPSPGVTPSPIPTPSPSPSPTATPSPTPSPSPSPGGTVMHVADIWTTDAAGNPKTAYVGGETVYTKIKIVDASGYTPVSGAVVTMQIWRPGDTSPWQTLTGTTGADGITTISKSLPNNALVGTWTNKVTNVTKAGWTYNAAANVKSQCTYSVS